MGTGSKVKIIFEAADSLLDQTDISNSHLSILHSGNGLSFSLLNKEKNKFVLLGAYQLSAEANATDTRELFEFLERFTEIPGEVSYASTESPFALIPQVLFDEAHKNDYLSLMSAVEPNSVGFKTFSNWVLVYQNRTELTDWVKTHLPNVKVLNNAEVVFSYYHNKYKNTDETAVFCHTMGNVLEITTLEKGVLTLHNAFNFENNQDFVYYVLSVYEQLKLNPEQVPTILSGWLNNLSHELADLKKYIRNIEWEERPAEFTYSYTFNDSAAHSFNRLFQQSLCVL